MVTSNEGLHSVTPLVRKPNALRVDGLKGLETPLDTPIFKTGKFEVLRPLTPAITIAVVAIRTREPLSVLADSNLNATAVRVDTNERFNCLSHGIISSVDNLI